MRFERKHALVLLGSTYLLVAYALYGALCALGPLSSQLLRYEGDPMANGYRIFFFSMQNAPVLYLAFLVLFVASVMYLREREAKWDAIASTSAKLGTLFCTLLIANGMIFSKLAWGAYWNWDPRQTTTLILWFVLISYLSLRAALEDEETRARLSAILGIFGFVGIPLTHISATIWASNHPQLYGESAFELDPAGFRVFGAMALGFLLLYAYLLWLGSKTELLEKEYERLKREV